MEPASRIDSYIAFAKGRQGSLLRVGLKASRFAGVASENDGLEKRVSCRSECVVISSQRDVKLVRRLKRPAMTRSATISATRWSSFVTSMMKSKKQIKSLSKP